VTTSLIQVYTVISDSTYSALDDGFRKRGVLNLPPDGKTPACCRSTNLFGVVPSATTLREIYSSHHASCAAYVPQCLLKVAAPSLIQLYSPADVTTTNCRSVCAAFCQLTEVASSQRLIRNLSGNNKHPFRARLTLGLPPRG